MPLAVSDAAEVDSVDQEYLWTLNFGPQHPATHTTLRLVLTLDGEKVVDAVPHIGYLHSGFEKLGEHLDFNQYVTIVDRMNYISPLANEIAWHHTVEKLLGIELTPRCKYLRTILAELMRLHDHLLNVGARRSTWGRSRRSCTRFTQREKIYDIVEYASGQRFHASYTRVGGVLFDVNNDWVDKVREFVEGFKPVHAEVHRLLTRNRIFIDRTQGHRRPHAGRRDQHERHRPAGPRQRRGPRPAQGRAVSRVRRPRLQGRLLQGRRLLRPLPRAHGRRCWRASRSSSRRSRTSRPAR